MAEEIGRLHFLSQLRVSGVERGSREGPPGKMRRSGHETGGPGELRGAACQGICPEDTHGAEPCQGKTQNTRNMGPVAGR